MRTEIKKSRIWRGSLNIRRYGEEVGRKSLICNERNEADERK